MYQEFSKFGKKLFESGLNNSHSGNISVRRGNHIIISRTGTMLDELTQQDIVKVNMKIDPNKDKKASMELVVHRAIYMADRATCAVVHAHCPYSIAQAEGVDEIIPYDAEGQYFLNTIHVVHTKNAIASGEVAAQIVGHVQSSHCVIVSKHGVFSWGKDLEEAYHYLTVCESACRVNYLLENKNAR
ncbi:MAG: hypothetical protein A2Y40_09645 [Candidatus Margulisbacteria bacterium GWF2_35_9]|nr:MAG: hypothetical protein A2Y40_09645 [Candidatus Margulisbacteria bacterium GWF2_35_9]